MSETFRLLKLFVMVFFGIIFVMQFIGGFSTSFLILGLLAAGGLVGLGLARHLGLLSSHGALERISNWASEPGAAGVGGQTTQKPRRAPASANVAARSKTPSAKASATKAHHLNADLLMEVRERAARLVGAAGAMHGLSDLFEELDGRRRAGKALVIGHDGIAVLYVSGGPGTGKTEVVDILTDCLRGFGLFSGSMVTLDPDQAADQFQRSENFRTALTSVRDRGLLMEDADWLFEDKDSRAAFWRAARLEAKRRPDEQMVIVMSGRHSVERVRAMLDTSDGSLRSFALPERHTPEGLATLVVRRLKADDFLIESGVQDGITDFFRGNEDVSVIDASSTLSRVAHQEGASKIGVRHVVALNN